ncbi:MAG: hypothetical protein WDN24_14485 [Sphingomonas sp.]
MARRRLICFALLGIASYAVAMVATIPASVAFKNRPWRAGVAGTVWNGEVGVTGGTVLSWRWAPLRSLTGLGFAADWRALGPGTDLGGQALAGLGGVALDQVSGTADAALLDVVQPGLPFACDMTGQVEFERIVAGGSAAMVAGRARSTAGSCRARGGAATALPPLILVAEKIGTESRIRIAPATQRLRTLIDAALRENGMVEVTVTPEGAKAMPFLGVPGGTKVQGRM